MKPKNLNNLFLKYSIVFLLFISCSKTEPILEISNLDNFIKLSEEIKKKAPIEKKNSKLLTSTEIINSRYSYWFYKTIHTEDQFKIVLILSSIVNSKNYNLIARTVNTKTNKVIDSFLIASYNKSIKNAFCKGFIYDDLKIERICYDFILSKQIDNFGKINLKK